MASETANSSRTRSFGGCTTCRSRHVKCDERRPTCAMCSYFGLVCAGYEKGIFFDFDSGADERRFRRPLLTEVERESMSRALVECVPPDSALQLLMRIDDLCEKAAPCRDLQVDCGPFGAFRWKQAPPSHTRDDTTEPATTSTPDIEAASPPQDILPIEDFAIPSDPPLSPRTQDFIDSIFGHTPSTEPPMDLCRIEAVLNDPPIQDLPIEQYPPFPPATLALSSLQFTPHKAIPQDAMVLLKHYTTTVISLMTPLRHQKTPWHILFIPQVKNSLAALTLGEDLDDASLATFYGTLALGAISLGGLFHSDTWFAQANTYKSHAQHHAQSMLRTAYNVPKPSKYKSTMTALLTMLYVSLFSADRDHTESFFLETERFIRLRGLHRKKSRKVRLLHHCYAFERFFYETTATESRQRHHFRLSIQSSGLAQYSSDSLSFRLRAWDDLDQEMQVVKSQEQGENDLHLEHPGIFAATLYPEIFGIPESWILLLSLVIRLGREKDLAEAQDTPDPLSLRDFTKRAKAVERRIQTLEPPFNSDNHLASVLEAIHHALAIFFYRRIYDLDSSVLLGRVQGVRDCLRKCETDEVLRASAGLIWAAFLGACEATTVELQDDFETWFRASATRTGLASFTETLSRVQRVWREKTSTGVSGTWNNYHPT
ncbi:fungal-specific transcription factor domain-containing protein [Aspergillus avenaceus]|uniref:Fungal-specific transcription factor domain-containing protein n=1 Tax=Aspergillus avenaceus TaxID=36643 RepID=A0A5N6U8W3_ASPAV|nr:fungal-specific transcription factor domain-containing protein [Aspergillus avenaceus]